MTGGGDDSSRPYQGTYTWDNTTTASGSQTVTATNGASDDRHRHLHRHQGHHRPHRPERSICRRPLVHDRSPSR